MSNEDTLNMLRDARDLALNTQTDSLLRIARSQLRWSMFYAGAFCVYLLVWLFAAFVLERPGTLMNAVPPVVFMGLCVTNFTQSSRNLEASSPIVFRR